MGEAHSTANSHKSGAGAAQILVGSYIQRAGIHFVARKPSGEERASNTPYRNDSDDGTT
jgi:hypothetical protein